MRRNPAIELYRVGAMFGIVLLHAIVQGGYLRDRGLDNVLLSCVTAFVFISGYYGIRFSVRKVVGFVAVGCYCSLVAAIVGGGGGCMVLDIIKYHWFLWAYLVLMCFAPILNSALEGEIRIVLMRVLPILVVVFGWSYLAMVPGVKNYCPSATGFGPLTPLTLIGIYLAARVSRLALSAIRVKGVYLVGVAVVSAGVAWIGFGHYNSMASLALAGSLFFLIERLRISERVGSVLSFIVPSLFPVYLMHCNAVGYTYLQQLNHYFIDDCHIWLYVSYVLTTTAVFVACLVIDVPRRLIVNLVERHRS